MKIVGLPSALRRTFGPVALQCQQYCEMRTSCLKCRASPQSKRETGCQYVVRVISSCLNRSSRCFRQPFRKMVLSHGQRPVSPATVQSRRTDGQYCSRCVLVLPLTGYARFRSNGPVRGPVNFSVHICRTGAQRTVGVQFSDSPLDLNRSLSIASRPTPVADWYLCH